MLRRILGKDSNNLIGIDIGSEQLKLLKINTATTPFKIENFAVASLPSGAMSQGEIKDTAAIARALETMLGKTRVATNNVALAIPRSATIIKSILIDSRLTPEDIETRAWIEANHQFPELVGDIYLDFFVGPSVQDNTQLELTLVACRKDQVKPYIEICKAAGLIAKIIDVNSYALERALQHATPNISQKNISLLNLDISLSTLIVEQEKNLIYAHDQSFDGHRLMSQTQEYLKNKQASEQDADYFNILKETLSAHLRHTMHFFYTSRPNINIEKIFLSGNCATIPFIDVFINREVGIETIIANPFINMMLDSNINGQEFKKNIPALMLCCGLAISKME